MTPLTAAEGITRADALTRWAGRRFLRRRRLKATEFMPFGLFQAPTIWIGWLLEALLVSAPSGQFPFCGDAEPEPQKLVGLALARQ